MSLGTDSKGVKKFIDSIESDSRALIKDVSTLSAWSETPIDKIWELTYLEREVLSEVVKEKVDLLYGKKGIARS